MLLTWSRENPAEWNADKVRVFARTGGAFDPARMPSQGVLPGEWWRAEANGRAVGYGWMDVVWGDAEILLAVEAEARGAGVGAFILHRLTREASARGLRRLYNVVPPGHPDGQRVTGWLLSHGFARAHGTNQLERPVPAR